MTKNIKGYVVDIETGEIMGNLYEGDKIVRKESTESFLENEEKSKETILWDADPFYKGFIRELKMIMPELNIYEKVVIFSILPYISYEDCCIKNKNGADIGTEELVVLSGINRGQLYKTINSLIKKDILYKGTNSRNRQYFVNPWLFCKGKQINKVLQNMFHNYYIRMYQMTWKDYIKDGKKKKLLK